MIGKSQNAASFLRLISTRLAEARVIFSLNYSILTWMYSKWCNPYEVKKSRRSVLYKYCYLQLRNSRNWIASIFRCHFCAVVRFHKILL